MRSIKELVRSYRSANSHDQRAVSSPTTLTREAVLWAYRLYLDRELESDRVVDEHLCKCSSTEELRNNVIYSNEFREKNPTLHVPVTWSRWFTGSP